MCIAHSVDDGDIPSSDLRHKTTNKEQNNDYNPRSAKHDQTMADRK
jgi:hypothetical protein